MTRITQYSVQVMVAEDHEGLELTPSQMRRIGQKMKDHLDRELELALYGGYAPAIDPSTVVAEQTPGQKRVQR